MSFKDDILPKGTANIRYEVDLNYAEDSIISDIEFTDILKNF